VPSRLLVERALHLIPDFDEFLPLTDALIGISEADGAKRWAGSHAYQALGKRVVDPERLGAMIPLLAARAQERLQELFSLVVRAIQAQQADRPADAAQLLIQAGELEEAQRRPDRAERLYVRALEIARDLREKEPQILAYRRLGRLMRGEGRLDEGFRFYEQSFELSAAQDDLPSQVIACQGLGNVCNDRGQRDRARAWYRRGLLLCRGCDDPQLEWPLLANLSVLARQGDELGEAETLLEQARHKIEEAGNEPALLFWYNNQGLLLSARGHEMRAEAAYREALALPLEPLPELTLRVNLGHSLATQGRLLEAEEEARRAEEVGILARLIPDLVDVYDLLGAIARHRRDEEGFVFYEQALSICRERELPRKTEATIYHGYGKLKLACAQVEEGVEYLELARGLYAELGLATELGRVVADLEAAAAGT
jgi:tetratricopeptide (TPR) repeat protein